MQEEQKIQQIMQQAKKLVALTAEEKNASKNHILQFMKAHPAGQVPVWRASFTSFMFRPQAAYALMAAVVLVVSGTGVSFAAQKALPGDWLYPVKTEVNERVLSFVAFSPEAKAKYEVRLAQLRLEEMEKVAIEKKLDERMKAKASVLLDKHIAKATAQAKKRESGNVEFTAEVHSELEASLKAHQQILSTLALVNADTAEGSGQLNALVSVIKEKKAATTKARQEYEKTHANSDLMVAAHVKMSAAQQDVKALEALLAAKRDVIGQEAFVRASQNINNANGLVQEGKTKLQIQDWRGAFSAFQQAIRMARETRITMEAAVEFNLPLPLRIDVKAQAESGDQEDDGQEALEEIQKEIEAKKLEIEAKIQGL